MKTVRNPLFCCLQMTERDAKRYGCSPSFVIHPTSNRTIVSDRSGMKPGQQFGPRVPEQPALSDAHAAPAAGRPNSDP